MTELFWACTGVGIGVLLMFFGMACGAVGNIDPRDSLASRQAKRDAKWLLRDANHIQTNGE